MRQLKIYTDGACHPNPNGYGGWGALIVEDGKEYPIYGGEAGTTNNRMEMMAAIQSLEQVEQCAQITIYTDSQYLRNGITKWINGWKRFNWKTRDGSPVKNKDLWERLDTQQVKHKITWKWVRGHNGHRENEIADELARTGRELFKNEGVNNNFNQY